MLAQAPRRAQRWHTSALPLLLLIVACGTVPKRNALPREYVEVAQIPGIPEARSWGDEVSRTAQYWLELPEEALQKRYPGIHHVPHSYLAISGGGANGAYGAGLLVGWTESGTRPEFVIVSGISTGALTAPFAFLGSDYDYQLTEIYNSYSTDDLVNIRSTLKGITSDAMADSGPLRELVEQRYTAEVLDAITAEYHRGRSLLIGTTNMDTMRPVIWNIGRIGASGDPGALKLFQDVLMASTALPIAFPPVLLEVEANGQRYDELHADGGVTTQVFLFPSQINWAEVCKKLDVQGTPEVYVLRNSRFAPTWKAVEPSVLSLAARTTDSLIRTQGLGDVVRLYLSALDNDLNFNLTFIPDEFELEQQEAFDLEYMRELYKVGKERALHGEPWQSYPPGFEHLDEPTVRRSSRGQLDDRRVRPDSGSGSLAGALAARE